MPAWAVVLIVIAAVLCVDLVVLAVLGARMRSSLSKGPAAVGNRAFWDRFAPMYALAMGKTDPAYDEVASQLADIITPEMDVLEVACGTGQFTGRLTGQANSWVACDFSAPMIDEARESGLPDDVRLMVADATDLPFDDASFDVVLIGNALHVMEDADAALAQARRVLVDGGLLLAPTFVHEPRHRAGALELVARYLGMRTYHAWDSTSLEDFVSSHGFMVEQCEVVDAVPLPMCLIVARRSERVTDPLAAEALEGPAVAEDPGDEVITGDAE
ncbi:MAG: methyltransferase domain-containing protein [Coriobacteriales bacterium]